MDSTPIYTELQQKLTDPEENNWGPSEPPEFVATLSEHTEEPEQAQPEPKKSQRKNASRAGGRRHRAED
ncbi:hypothetical protein [Parasphingorhabdus pacifica]